LLLSVFPAKTRGPKTTALSHGIQSVFLVDKWLMARAYATPPRDPAFYAHVTDKEHLLLFTKVSNTIFPKARTLRKNFPQAIITVKNEKEQVKKNRKNYEIYEFVYKLS